MASPTKPVGPQGAVTLAEAQSIVDTALSEASSRGVAVAVAVASPSGHLVALARMDGIPPISTESARRKCVTVALTWRSTSSFAAAMRSDLEAEPEYFHGMHHVGDVMTIGGGVPLIRQGGLAGAVAISGASTEDDVAIAEAAASSFNDRQGEIAGR